MWPSRPHGQTLSAGCRDVHTPALVSSTWTPSEYPRTPRPPNTTSRSPTLHAACLKRPEGLCLAGGAWCITLKQRKATREQWRVRCDSTEDEEWWRALTVHMPTTTARDRGSSFWTRASDCGGMLRPQPPSTRQYCTPFTACGHEAVAYSECTSLRRWDLLNPPNTVSLSLTTVACGARSTAMDMKTMPWPQFWC